MSSSSKPALASEPKPEVRPFPYAELPPGASAGVVQEHAASMRANAATTVTAAGDAAASVQHAAAVAERQQWEAQVRAGFEQRLQEVRESVRIALLHFAEERTLYFHQVEAEVVQLALGIARKILRRESEIDPLLLAGMVRVALERVEAGTKVTVRVHPQQVSECRAYFAQGMEAQQVPEVLEDAKLPLNHCILQTAMGATELGPEVQFKEIEQGLLDLLARRPQARK